MAVIRRGYTLPRIPTPRLGTRFLRGSVAGPTFFIREILSGGASAANVTVTTGAGTLSTDLLVAFHGNDFYLASQLGGPTTGTWVLQATGDDGNDSAHMKVFTSTANGGAQAVTVAPAVDEEHELFVFVVANTLGTVSVDGAAGGNGASSTSHIAPAVSPVGSADILLCAAQSTAVGNYTAPGGMGQLTEVDVLGFCTGAAATQTLTSSGSTGTRTFTLSVASTYATASIALQPTGGAPPPASSPPFPRSRRVQTLMVR